MKTRILLLSAAVMFLGWSCDKDENTNPSGPKPTVVVDTPEAVQNALDNGSTTITLDKPLSQDAAFTVPNSYPANSEVKIVVPANGHDVVISQNNSKSQAFPVINLDIESAEELTVLTPNCSVLFNGSASTVIASTAANTFTVAKGSVITELNVIRGNTKIYGLVASVKNTGSGKVYLAVGSGSDRPTNDNIIRHTMALDYVDGIILTEDKYPLNPNIVAVGSEFNQNDASYMWYLPIEKDGFEIIGDGNVENIILYGKDEQLNGAWSSQNLISVFASNVRISGITLMNKIEGNKMIEVLKPGFTVSNCRFVPNTEVQEDEENFVGGVYFSQKANNGLVEDNYFSKGTVSVDGLMSGTFTVKGNTFDGVYGNDYVVISTPNWTTNNVSTSTMSLTLTENTFRNVPEFAGSITYPVLNIKYGTVTLSNNTFPTQGVYYRVTEYGKLVLNGVTIVPTV